MPLCNVIVMFMMLLVVASLKSYMSSKITSTNVHVHVLCWSAVSHLLRDTAAGRVGPVTHIGLGTFVDPREQVLAI